MSLQKSSSAEGWVAQTGNLMLSKFKVTIHFIILYHSQMLICLFSPLGCEDPEWIRRERIIFWVLEEKTRLAVVEVREG